MAEMTLPPMPPNPPGRVGSWEYDSSSGGWLWTDAGPTLGIDGLLIGASDPALQGNQLQTILNNIALGLGAFDPTQQINAVQGDGCAAPVVTPDAPIGLAVIGLKDQFGLAWGLQATLANVRGFEVERGLDGVTFVSLGEVATRTYIDQFDTNGLPFAPNTTRFYRVRAVVQTGSAVTYSAYSLVVSATTADINVTNATLTTNLNDWASSIQANQFLLTTIDKVLGDRLQQLYSFATFMGGGDRPALTDAVALVDLENRSMAFATFMGR